MAVTKRKYCVSTVILVFSLSPFCFYSRFLTEKDFGNLFWDFLYLPQLFTLLKKVCRSMEYLPLQYGTLCYVYLIVVTLKMYILRHTINVLNTLHTPFNACEPLHKAQCVLGGLLRWFYLTLKITNILQFFFFKSG